MTVAALLKLLGAPPQRATVALRITLPTIQRTGDAPDSGDGPHREQASRRPLPAKAEKEGE